VDVGLGTASLTDLAADATSSEIKWALQQCSAIALHCCKAHSNINRKMENSTPCKMVTPENFILKLGTCDDVEEITYYTIFDADRLSGASPQIGEI